VHNARFAENGGTYLDTWSSPDVPPNSSLRDSKGAVTHWLLRNALDDAHPFHPYVSDRVPEEYGSLKASDGQDLYYRLTKPAHMEPGRRYPVVVDVYGGPGVQTVRREWMSGGTGTGGYFRQILAQHDFIVFAIDNRGSKNRGAKFASVIKGQLGKFEVEDQVRGIEWLQQQPFVDGNRIGVTGWSYGGYMSLMCLSTAPAVFKVAIAGAPVTNWRLYDTHYTERYLDRPQTNGTGYDASGVLAHIEGIRGKLLLVHGMADDNVLFANSTELMKALQDRGVQFDLMTYPGAKHALARAPATGKHFYELSLEFLERELKK
jgi:dipeptidyl-peptidase-4